MTLESARPNLASAALRAIGAGLLGAGIWIGLAGPLNVTWGLIAVAAFVGWLIGSATRSGAHGRRSDGARRASSAAPVVRAEWRVRAIAVGGALFAWLLALVGVYLYSLATISDLPGAGRAGTNLIERIGSTSIVAFHAQQFDPTDGIALAVLVGAAWWSSR